MNGRVMYLKLSAFALVAFAFFAISCDTPTSEESVLSAIDCTKPNFSLTGLEPRCADCPLTEINARERRAALPGNGGCEWGPGTKADRTVGAVNDRGQPILLGNDNPIQYIFILVFENRSFDSYYGRFQAYLSTQSKLQSANDMRTKTFVSPECAEGIDVPGTPYEELSLQEKTVADSYSGLNPKLSSPYNPSVAGTPPTDKNQKHYWRHAKGEGEQCVSDTNHEWWAVHLQLNKGRMDGFFQSNDGFWEGGSPDVGKPPTPLPPDWYQRPNAPSDGTLLRGDRAMLFYNQDDIPFYYWLAETFALGDRYFSSVPGPTFVNRDYLYGATSRGLTSNSSDNFGSSIFSLPNVFASNVIANPSVVTVNAKKLHTIYESLDAHGVKYAQWVRDKYSDRLKVARWGAWFGFGVPNTSQIQAKKDYKELAKSLESENERLKTSQAPQLAAVNFIDPDILEDVNGEDEHPPATPQMGQRFTYDVVRTLMKNPEVWKRSVLFIAYDEHGGFYDHVLPPPACKPDNLAPTWSGAYGEGPKAITHTDKLYGGGFDQYGIRTPFLVISPWVMHAYVSHHTYDHTSILRFIEARFNLPALTKRDANADPLFDFFDFTNKEAKLAGQVSEWGKEELPAEFSTLQQPLVNRTCQDLFPPAPFPSSISPTGKKVYSGYDWSPGIPPPISQ